MGNVLSWAMRLVATVTFCVFSVFSWSEEPAALGTCIACHGKSGMAVSAEYPNLGGQYEDYLTLQLTNFRSGDRQNAVMNGIAAQLTDADIAALSAWFSAQPHHTAANGDAKLVEEGRNRAAYCHACHGMQGHPVAEVWPILSGQSAPYLANQMAGYKQGTRHHPLMVNVVRDLSAPAIAALSAYYSQHIKPD